MHLTIFLFLEAIEFLPLLLWLWLFDFFMLPSGGTFEVDFVRDGAALADSSLSCYSASPDL